MPGAGGQSGHHRQDPEEEQWAKSKQEGERDCPTSWGTEEWHLVFPQTTGYICPILNLLLHVTRLPQTINFFQICDPRGICELSLCVNPT